MASHQTAKGAPELVGNTLRKPDRFSGLIIAEDIQARSNLQVALIAQRCRISLPHAAVVADLAFGVRGRA
jgi:hypothetical protein